MSDFSDDLNTEPRELRRNAHFASTFALAPTIMYGIGTLFGRFDFGEMIATSSCMITPFSWMVSFAYLLKSSKRNGKYGLAGRIAFCASVFGLLWPFIWLALLYVSFFPHRFGLRDF